MKRTALYLCIFLLPFTSFAAVTDLDKAVEEIRANGHDVRNRNAKYSLYIGPENSLLEERPYKLIRVQNGRKKVVHQGTVIMVAPGSSDIQEMYSNQELTIRFARPFTIAEKQKQIVVLKFKNDGKSAPKTIAFENYIL